MTTRVLFVCLGNICRSPTAEVVFRQLVHGRGLSRDIEVASAGTGSWHIGEPPDQRTQEAALLRGLDMSEQRARQVEREDFLSFDYLLAMDRQNLENMQQFQPDTHAASLGLFMEYAPNSGSEEVPDPYYGGVNGFNIVLDMVEEASEGLLAAILSSSEDRGTES